MNDLLTARHPQSSRPCWTKGNLRARSARGLACWLPNSPCENGAINFPLRPPRHLNSWPTPRIRSGHGTSPACLGREPGPGSASTSCRILTAALSAGGGWPSASAPHWPPVHRATVSQTGHSAPSASLNTPPAAHPCPAGPAPLLANLGLPRSLRRPRVRADPSFSEAQFQILTSPPGFPARCEHIPAARADCRHCFPWYNRAHRHAGIARLDSRGCSPWAHTAEPGRNVRAPCARPGIETRNDPCAEDRGHKHHLRGAGSTRQAQPTHWRGHLQCNQQLPQCC